MVQKDVCSPQIVRGFGVKKKMIYEKIDVHSRRPLQKKRPRTRLRKGRTHKGAMPFLHSPRPTLPREPTWHPTLSYPT